MEPETRLAVAKLVRLEQLARESRRTTGTVLARMGPVPYVAQICTVMAKQLVAYRIAMRSSAVGKLPWDLRANLEHTLEKELTATSIVSTLVSRSRRN